MTYFRITSTVSLCGLLAACGGSTTSPTPAPTFADLTADRDRIEALATTSAMQSDLPPSGTASYAGAYAGVFGTSTTSDDTRVAGPVTVTAAFGAMPTASFDMTGLTSPDAADFEGNLTVEDIPIAMGSFEQMGTLNMTNVPLEGGATAGTLSAEVLVLGRFTTNTNHVTGIVGTGASNGFNLNGRYGVERQP